MCTLFYLPQQCWNKADICHHGDKGIAMSPHNAMLIHHTRWDPGIRNTTPPPHPYSPQSLANNRFLNVFSICNLLLMFVTEVFYLHIRTVLYSDVIYMYCSRNVSLRVSPCSSMIKTGGFTETLSYLVLKIRVTQPKVIVLYCKSELLTSRFYSQYCVDNQFYSHIHFGGGSTTSN